MNNIVSLCRDFHCTCILVCEAERWRNVHALCTCNAKTKLIFMCLTNFFLLLSFEENKA